MNYYIKILKDKKLDNFVGITIPPDVTQPFLNQLSDIVGDDYQTYTKLQQDEDQGQYYIGVMTGTEFNTCSKSLGFDKFLNHLDHLMKVNFDDVKLIGLGKSEKGDNKSFYIVVKSELLHKVREDFLLPEKDFHITIGFKWKDVQGVRKNEVYQRNQKFIKKLKDAFIGEGESFEFIKGLKNFDFDFFKLIEPIEINDTNAIFRCGSNDYLQISLIDDSLTISAKWQDTNKKPILSETLVRKKLNKI
jgi:hypothetical protein